MKKPVVTRKFLLAFANRIYNPKSKEFLRLCNGTLQNGPDPTDKKRPMHCGLGELYFELTGKHPEEAEESVNEDDVIDLAVEMSHIPAMAQAEREKAIRTVRRNRLPKVVTNAIVESICDIGDSALVPIRDRFWRALDLIADENDADGCRSSFNCNDNIYRLRAARVAKQIRIAARILPE